MTTERTERVALVTGGSRGIGRATAEALLEDGWKVTVCARSAEPLREAVVALRAAHGARIEGEEVDVRDPQAVERLVRGIVDAEGRLDCLVNSAGLGVFEPVTGLSVEAWRRVIDTNLSGAFYALRAAARVMIEQGGGWIFNIASLAATHAIAGGAAYNASKFGLLGLSEAAMLDLRRYGVKVATILPGSVDTDFRPPERRTETAWMLQAEDVARAVTDLLRYPGRALPSRVELRPTRPPER